MKLLIIFAFSLASLGAFAQVPENRKPWIINEGQLFDELKGTKGDSLRKQFQNYLQKKQFQNQASSSKYGIVTILPQDNMPCLIPDTKTLTAMPNAWSGKITVPYRPQYHPIPNPSLPPVSLSYSISNSLQPGKKL